jgi:hypothetical protein
MDERIWAAIRHFGGQAQLLVPICGFGTSMQKKKEFSVITLIRSME